MGEAAQARRGGLRALLRLGRTGPLGFVLIWTFAALLLAVAGGALSWKIRAERELELEQLDRNNMNLARALEEHTLRTLKSVDQAVLFLKFQYEKHGRDIDVQSYAREGMIITTLFNQLGVIDEHGLYILSNLPGHKVVDLSDREHFRVHVEKDSGQLFISKPVLGRASGKWSIQMTRRINKADGAFGGVVTISLDPFYFTSLYSDVKVGAHGLIELAGTDGVVRARRSGDDIKVGQDLLGSPLFKAAEGRTEGTYQGNSRIDGVARRIAFRKMRDFPMLVVVGVSLEEAMADYRARVDSYLQFGALTGLLILTFAAVASALLVSQRQVAAEMRAGRLEAEEANRLKSEFLASMSHELRTPLNGIIGYAELLRDDAGDESHKEFAGTILTSGRHLLQLVNSILDLAKVEAGRMELSIRAESPAALAEEVRRAHLPSAQAKGLTLSLVLSEELPATVDCDRTRLLQVLNNLLHNAVKFTPAGSVELSLRPAGEAVRFGVRDTGPGIAPERQAAIFEKFRQEGEFVTREHGGTGLGLSLARQLVELMGGRLQLRSSPGEGSDFFFELAASRAQPVRRAA
jgi:two-component system, NarL family, sensor histidine kinase BarA